VEPARSTIYRSFLIATLPILVLLGTALRMPAFLALAGAWTIVLAVSALLARSGLNGIRVSREVYPSAFEGDEVPVTLVLECDRPVRRIEIADAFGAAIVTEQRMLEPGPVGPEARRRLSYSTLCSRQWGMYAMGPVRVQGSDPAGLFRSRRVLPVVEEFAVFPRVYDVAGLARLGAQRSLAPHEATASRIGQSLLYLGVRDYRPGDDLRHIHWPATARRGTLVVKEHEVDLAPYVTIFADLERRHRAGIGKKSTHEYVIRTAASIVWSALREGGFVQIAGLGRRPLHVPPGRGETHLAFALYELIRAAQDGKVALPELVLQHLPSVPAGSTAVLLSGTLFLELGPLEDVIEGLRGRGARPVAILVNNFSFPAISGWPPPRAEIVEKRREVEFFLRSRGVPTQILEEADDLEAALGRGEFAS
jgi:uncharacterized protein (DUF58 family)